MGEEVVLKNNKKGLFKDLNKLEKFLMTLYLIVSILIYIVIIVLDILENYHLSFSFKFNAVIINALYALFVLLYSYKLNNLMVLFNFLGLLLTIGSDYFLGYRSDSESGIIMGLFIFILVQILYFIRIFIYLNKKEKKLYLMLTIFIRLFVIFIKTILVRNLFDSIYYNPIYILAVVYFLLIIMNFVDNMYISIKFDRRYLLLALGFLLFIFCDINVGLNFLVNHRYIYFLIYLFYIPSQILIALSSNLENKPINR